MIKIFEIEWALIGIARKCACSSTRTESTPKITHERDMSKNQVYEIVGMHS